MIDVIIILTLSAVFIAGLITFWKKIVGWIQKAVNKIKEVLGITPEGTKTFISKTIEGFKNKSKYYYRNQVSREWEEVAYTKEVDESEVPSDILAKLQRQAVGMELETTEELKLAIHS